MTVYVVINPEMHSHEALVVEKAFVKKADAEDVIRQEIREYGECNWFVLPLEVKE